jgi:hypothetical protein
MFWGPHDLTRQHIANPSPTPGHPSADRYLLVKGKAGLGNRLLCTLSSILYAEITGRKLYIDWTDEIFYGLNGKNGFTELFDAPRVTVPEPFWDSDSVTPVTWQGNLRRSASEFIDEQEPDRKEPDACPRIAAKYTIDLGNLNYSERVAVRWAWNDELWRLRPHLKGAHSAWAELSDEEILQKLAQRLVLAPIVLTRAEDFRNREFRQVTIGMHIRYTDRKNSYAKYDGIASRIMRNHPTAAVFLATDNKAVEDDLRRRYPHLIVTPKWFAPPGTPLHRTRECPDALERSVEALIEMYLLSRCDYLIYDSTSTYGIMARLFSQAPPENVWNTAPKFASGLRRLRHHIRETFGY